MLAITSDRLVSRARCARTVPSSTSNTMSTTMQPLVVIVTQLANIIIACDFCLPNSPDYTRNSANTNRTVRLWETQIFGNFPSRWPRPLFLWLWFLWWVCASPSCMLNLKLLALAIAEILEGIPKFWGAHLAQGYTQFFLWV